MKKYFLLFVTLISLQFGLQGQTITGPASICPNENINYLLTGTLPTGCNFDSWNKTDPNVTLTNALAGGVTVNANTSAGNSFDLQYYKKCSTATATLATSKTITVNVVDPPFLSPSISNLVCSTSPTVFTVTATSAGANTFVWSVTGGTFPATTGNVITITKSPTCLEKVVITCTAKRSDCSSYLGETTQLTMTTAVTLPSTITGPAGLCAGTATPFSVSSPPNSCYTYNWYFSPATAVVSITNANTANPTLTYLGGADGTKYLKCQISACNRSVLLSKNIQVCAGIVTPTDIAASQQGPSCYYKFTATGSCATTWDWQINNGIIETNGSNIYTPVDPGTYNVKVRAVNGCGTSAFRSENFTLNPIVHNPPCQYKVDPTAMQAQPAAPVTVEGELAQFTIFPNPIVGNQDIQVTCSEKMLGSKLEIFDLHGNKVHEMSVTEPNFGISTETLADGLYFGRLSSGTQVLVQRVLITK